MKFPVGAWLGAIPIILSGCVPDRIEIGPSSASITEGSDVVQSRSFPILSEDGAVLETNGMELAELSRVGSPVIGSNTVQATDVQFRGDLLFATYNTKGDLFQGALQVIDLSDPDNPSLLEEALFLTSEANRVRVQGEFVYVAGGDEFLSATLETFRYADGSLTHLSTLVLPGYQTTMLQVSGDRAFATVGDIGGLVVLDLTDPAAPAVADILPLADARYVEDLGDDVVVLTGGTGATLSRYNLPVDGAWGAPTATADVLGVTVGAPSWGNRIGNDLYISADVGGVAQFGLEGGQIIPLGVIPTSGDANGLAPTPDQRLAVLANGQEGLVAIEAGASAEDAFLGSYDVPDDCGSANAIAIQHDIIAMADGLGGVKFLRYNVNQVAGRLVTLLLTFSNPGIPESVAGQLASQAVNWTSPRTPSKVIVIRDDYHNGEFATDTQFVVDLLRGQGYDVDYLEEPGDGVDPSHVDGYDVVWFANPGWPLDDRKTFDTLVAFSDAGGGVVLQGDDMTWSSSRQFEMSPLTFVEHVNNGTSFCGVGIDNNAGGKYRVTFESDSDHPVIDGLEGVSFTYGDDIDHSIPLGAGEEVLAWATLDEEEPGNCDTQSPVVITFGPERAAQLQGIAP